MPKPLPAELEEYERLITFRIRNLVSPSPVMDWEDIRQEAYLGLLEAAQRFDGERASFQTFAYHRIRGRPADAIRTLAGTRRKSITQVVSLDERREREPSGRVFRHTFDDDSVRDASYFEPVAGDPEPSVVVELQDRLDAVWREAANLEEPYRSVVVWLFQEGVTLKIAADRLGLGVSKVSEIRDEAIEWLRFQMAHKGLLS